MLRLAFFVVAWMPVWIGSADAAVVVNGANLIFNGPGTYTFDFTIENTGATTETITGFTVPLVTAADVAFVAEVPDTSLSDIDFTPNALLESKGSSSDFGAFGFSITANDLNGSPLVLNAGQADTLFTIDFVLGPNATPGTVASVVQTPPLSALLDIVGASAVIIGSPAATAVPEPSGVLLILAIGGLVLYRSRRRVLRSRVGRVVGNQQ